MPLVISRLDYITHFMATLHLPCPPHANTSGLRMFIFLLQGGGKRQPRRNDVAAYSIFGIRHAHGIRPLVVEVPPVRQPAPNAENANITKPKCGS